MGAANSMAALDLIPLDLVLFGVTGIALIAFLAWSGLLFWHWQLYSTGKYTTMGTFIVYLSVSGALLTLMGLSAFWFAIH